MKGQMSLEVVGKIVLMSLVVLLVIFLVGKYFISFDTSATDIVTKSPIERYEACALAAKLNIQRDSSLAKKYKDRDGDGVYDHCDRCLGGVDNVQILDASAKGGVKHGHDNDLIPDDCDNEPDKKNQILGKNPDILEKLCNNFKVYLDKKGKIKDFYCCVGSFTTANHGCKSRT